MTSAGVVIPRPTFTLVIPTYGQRRRTRESARAALAFLDGLPDERGEILVVDDGSPAGEGVEAGDLPDGVRLLRHPRNLGKGAAVASGVATARADLIIATDSDLPFSMDPVPTTLAWLRRGADLVIGNRLHPESRFETEVPPLRRLSSAVFSWVVHNVVGLDFADTQCGYKGYRTPVARELFAELETFSFAFEVEILARAVRAGYSIRQQPLSLLHDEDSSVRLSRHALPVALDTLRIGRRARAGRYDRRGDG